jgi:nickel transport protein
MPRRFGALTALALVLLGAGEVQAHRLDAQAFYFPDQKKVQIESWFDSGQVARGARVQVFRDDGQLLAEGILDQEGRFVFGVANVEPLRVVVNAGGGHRKELEITAADLERSLPAGETPVDPNLPRQDAAPTPIAVGGPRPGERIKDVLIGVTFLLALAAFVLSWRNARRIRTLKQPDERLPGK